MSSTIDAKKALEYATDKQKTKINRLLDQAKLAEMMVDLKEHGGMKALTNSLEAMVNACNQLLIGQKEMDAVERAVILESRNIYIWFIELFPEAQTRLDNIAKKIKRYE